MVNDIKRTSQFDRGETLFAGIHLSGPNARRTAVIISTGNILETPLKLRGLYEKIGAMGKVFSDDRLVDILQSQGSLAHTVIDCPLTVPPCVACTRPQCPGVRSCDDVGVAYILALVNRLMPRQARKRRPINPQSQRVWDVRRLLEQGGQNFEPSFSANLAPLAARALTLQRRLNSLAKPITLHETSVPLALEAMAEALGFTTKAVGEYRDFADGRERRAQLLDAMQEQHWLDTDADTEHYLAQIEASVELFHALVSSMVASLLHYDLCVRPPDAYADELGWVYLPALSRTTADAQDSALDRGDDGHH